MARAEMVEKFRNHGIMVEEGYSERQAFDAMKDLQPDELWPVVEDFTNGNPIGINFANRTIHRLTLSYALVHAFRDGRDSIEQADLDVAFEKAAKLSDLLAPKGATRPDPANEDTYEVDEDGSSRPVRKNKRDPGLQPLVFTLVESNPKAQGTEIVDMVHETKPDANDGTIKVYYSKARKELGLPNIGKRGRRAQ